MKQTTTWLALLPWAALSTTALADEATDARVTKLEQELEYKQDTKLFHSIHLKFQYQHYTKIAQLLVRAVEFHVMQSFQEDVINLPEYIHPIKLNLYQLNLMMLCFYQW